MNQACPHCGFFRDQKPHVNRVPFTGVLARVDEASARPPCGAMGHRVWLMAVAAEQAIPSLIGMPLEYKRELDAHRGDKVGIITGAEIIGRELTVKGYIFARDYPRFVEEVIERGESLGMSYEMANVLVHDVSQRTWVIKDTTFTGVAVLLRDKAAYDDTSITIEAEQVKEKI